MFHGRMTDIEFRWRHFCHIFHRAMLYLYFLFLCWHWRMLTQRPFHSTTANVFFLYLFICFPFNFRLVSPNSALYVDKCIPYILKTRGVFFANKSASWHFFVYGRMENARDGRAFLLFCFCFESYRNMQSRHRRLDCCVAKKMRQNLFLFEWI